jgi:hypothetical protein
MKIMESIKIIKTYKILSQRWHPNKLDDTALHEQFLRDLEPMCVI